MFSCTSRGNRTSAKLQLQGSHFQETTPNGSPAGWWTNGAAKDPLSGSNLTHMMPPIKGLGVNTSRYDIKGNMKNLTEWDWMVRQAEEECQKQSWCGCWTCDGCQENLSGDPKDARCYSCVLGGNCGHNGSMFAQHLQMMQGAYSGMKSGYEPPHVVPQLNISNGPDEVAPLDGSGDTSSGFIYTNKAGCPKGSHLLHTKVQCKLAAKQLGLVDEGEVHWPEDGAPVGCYWNKQTKKLHFRPYDNWYDDKLLDDTGNQDPSKYTSLCYKPRPGVCVDTPGFKDELGTCRDYKEKKYCTSGGGRGDGWIFYGDPKTSFDKDSTHTPASECCACGGGLWYEKPYDNQRNRWDGSWKFPSTAVGPARIETLRNGPFTFMMQADGNLVLYNTIDRGGDAVNPVWDSGTHGNPGAVLELQEDGNLVIYSKDKRVLWAADTAGTVKAFLTLQNDGNVVLYSMHTGDPVPVWATKTEVAGLVWQGNGKRPVLFNWDDRNRCRQYYNKEACMDNARGKKGCYWQYGTPERPSSAFDELQKAEGLELSIAGFDPGSVFYKYVPDPHSDVWDDPYFCSEFD